VSDGGAVVRPGLLIPRHELAFRASRAGGPGGQHVNTSSTRVEVVWNVRRSAALTADERERVLAKLASRIDGDGNLRVVSSEFRSQARNREAAVERLGETVRKALHVPRSRKKTRPTRSSVEKRLSEKKLKSSRKKDRGLRDFE
jgi:ribosome-associated protein